MVYNPDRMKVLSLSLDGYIIRGKDADIRYMFNVHFRAVLDPPIFGKSEMTIADTWSASTCYNILESGRVKIGRVRSKVLKLFDMVLSSVCSDRSVLYKLSKVVSDRYEGGLDEVANIRN